MAQIKWDSSTPINFILPEWGEILNPIMKDKRFDELMKKLQNDSDSGINIFPNKIDILKAFRFSVPTDIKVVILGQDPYHGEGQATGLAFAVKNSMSRPPSLKNILKELSTDLEKDVSPFQSDLTGWAKQGVLLLNTSLTVKEGKPLSYAGDWSWFTDLVIQHLCDVNKRMVFLLWGNHAKSKSSIIGYNHYVLTSAHPSPLSVRNFYGCRHFSQANKILEDKLDRKPIDWTDLSLSKPNDQ